MPPKPMIIISQVAGSGMAACTLVATAPTGPVMQAAPGRHWRRSAPMGTL